MPDVEVLKRAYRIFSGKSARFLGAAIAFYALLSAAPLFLVIVHVVGAFFGRHRAEAALWGGLERWITADGIATIRQLTERFEKVESGRSWIGIVMVVYGSTRLFRALRLALNQLWDIDVEAVEAKRKTAMKYGRRYGSALALALFTALLVALIVIEKSVFALAELPSGLVWSVDLVTSVAITFALFLVLFRFLPEAKVTLRDAAVSALVSTLLFAAGSSIVTAYIQHKHMSDLYAGASAVVLAVVWVYYSAQVFFFGACIGCALRERRG